MNLSNNQDRKNHLQGEANTIHKLYLHNGGAADCVTGTLCWKLHDTRLQVKSNLHLGCKNIHLSANLQLGNALHGTVGW